VTGTTTRTQPFQSAEARVAWAAQRYQRAQASTGNHVSTSRAVRFVEQNGAALAFAEGDPVIAAVAAARDKSGGELTGGPDVAVAAAAREYQTALQATGVTISMPEAVKAVEKRAREEWVKAAEAEVARVRRSRMPNAAEHLKALLG
jgi:hypothetical protein